MNSHFKTGTGCFVCQACGKRTRQTGKHNYHMQDQCDACIDFFEHENAINDNEGIWSPEYMAKEIKSHMAMQNAFDERCKIHQKVTQR